MTSSKSKYSQMNLLQLRNELANYIRANKALEPSDVFDYRVYIAGPWFTPKDHDVMQYIQSEVHKYYCTGVYFPIEHTQASPKDTYEENINAIREADAVIALIMSKDVGTAMEIGYAKGLGKPVFLIAYDESCFQNKTNIMLAYAGDEIFYLKDLVALLRGVKAKSFAIKDTWEGKE